MGNAIIDISIYYGFKHTPTLLLSLSVEGGSRDLAGWDEKRHLAGVMEVMQEGEGVRKPSLPSGTPCEEEEEAFPEASPGVWGGSTGWEPGGDPSINQTKALGAQGAEPRRALPPASDVTAQNPAETAPEFQFERHKPWDCDI